MCSEDLVYLVAEAIGTEARAVFNNASRHGDFAQMKGISCLAPFVNVMRHPLWGRVQVFLANCSTSVHQSVACLYPVLFAACFHARDSSLAFINAYSCYTTL